MNIFTHAYDAVGQITAWTQDQRIVPDDLANYSIRAPEGWCIVKPRSVIEFEKERHPGVRKGGRGHQLVDNQRGHLLNLVPFDTDNYTCRARYCRYSSDT